MLRHVCGLPFSHFRRQKLGRLRYTARSIAAHKLWGVLKDLTKALRELGPLEASS